MSEGIICLRLFILGGIASLLVMVGAGSVISPVRAQPPAPNIAATKTTEADPDLAVVHEFLEAIAATLKSDPEASSSEGYGLERGVWRLPTTWCVNRLGLPKDKPIEACKVQEVSGRRAAIVIVVKACADEHCDVDYWILSGRSGLRPSPIPLEFESVVPPGNKVLFTGHTAIEPHGYEAHLVRLSMDTLQSSTVAACAAPTLSPSERWVVCRDVSGHVHRLAIDGERLEAVHTIDLGEEVIYRSPHLGVNLPPVQFIQDNRMRIVTLTAEGTEDVEEARWVDGP